MAKKLSDQIEGAFGNRGGWEAHLAPPKGKKIKPMFPTFESIEAGAKQGGSYGKRRRA